MNIIFLIFIHLFFLNALSAVMPSNNGEADIRVNQYINFIQSYCNNGYSEDDFQYLLSQCADPSILVDNDIPGVQKSLDELILYLRMLKKYKIIVQYERDFTIASCKTMNGNKFGCFLKKKVTSKTGVFAYEEFIELTNLENTYKIRSIQSNLFPASVVGINCSEESIYSTSQQINMAEENLNSGNVEEAIIQYLEVRPFNQIKSPKLEKKLLTVNLDSIFQKRYEQADLEFQKGNYEEAVSRYESIIRSYSTLSFSFKEKITSKIKECKDQIEYLSSLQLGNLYFSQKDYNNAISAYIKCLLIRPNDSIVKDKLLYCKGSIAEAFNAETRIDVQKAENLILSNKKNNRELGFSILMKYVHSDKINGKQYFLMAQIVDSPSARTSKEFNLNSRKRCLLTHQFMLNAHALGYNSEGFDIYWNEYLTEKSRSCD